MLVVNYNATLNKNAMIGYDGNLNDVYLEYSNNPSTPTSHGETPKDKVIVFTYQADVNKYDTSKTPLEGAEFVLMNENGEYYTSKGADGNYWVTNEDDAERLVSDKDGWFVVRGLDKGTYVLKEVKAPKLFRTVRISDKVQAAHC